MLTLLTASLAVAAPTTVHHQGRVLDASGAGLQGPTTLQFDLMDAASGGASQWTEVHVDVPVEGGYYAVLLGNDEALDEAAITGDRWLAVSVGGVELSRSRVSSVPWALRTEVAEGVHFPGVAGGIEATCLASEVGSMRFNTDIDALEVCRSNDGSPGWTALAMGKTIVGDDTLGRAYSDGTVAESCLDYLEGGNYQGEIGSGNYRIAPPGGSLMRVACDMETDGGGWTLVFREAFTDREDGPSGAEMNSSSGDPITGEGRINPIATYQQIGATDVMYDLETHQLVTPGVSAADWAWFMNDSTVASTRNMSDGAYIVGGTSWSTVHHHKWSGSQGQISTNTTWDSAAILDYNADSNHGWALWTAANGVYKRLGGYQTPVNVTVRMYIR